MSGFLDKKKRLIDYKLTEFGREKLSKGELRFEYYTFSDRSIVYSQSLTDSYDYAFSDSLDGYIPFEANSKTGLIINPEFVLNDIMEQENTSLTRQYDIIRDTNKTLSDYISSNLYLDTKTIDNKINRSEIVFSKLINDKVYDFNNPSFISRYPTIKFLTENIDAIKNIKDDKRLSFFTRNKKLVPINFDGSLLEDIEINDFTPSGFVFNHLELNNIEFNNVTNREEAISKIVKALKNNNDKLFKLEYHFLEDDQKEEDLYMFELHSIIDENNLNKIACVNLGKFIDKETQNNFEVYLFGKLLKSVDKSIDFNTYNRTQIFEINKDYMFINIFTMVVE